jgi:hypothetical protein
MADSSKKEADWTQSIPSETICQYFYVIFFIIAVYVGFVLVADIYLISKNPRLGFSILLRNLPVLALAIANGLFMYIICARALLK